MDNIINGCRFVKQLGNNKNNLKQPIMNARQKRIEKSGYKITWFINDNHDYKLQATKNNRTIKATSISNLYNQLFNN